MRTYITAVLMLGGAGAAGAQLCTGNMLLTRSHFQVAVNVAKDSFAMRYAGEFRAATHGLFAAAEVGLKTWEKSSLNAESNAYGLHLGYAVPLGTQKLAICPVVAGTLLTGPQQYKQVGFVGGLTAGYLLKTSRAWDIVPIIAVSAGDIDRKLKGYTPGGPVPLPPYWRPFCCGHVRSSMVSVGIGIGFSRQIALLPSVAFPLGKSDEVTTYGLRAAMRLGKGL